MAKRTNKSPKGDTRQSFPAKTVERFAQALAELGGLNDAIKFLWNEDGQDRSEQSWRNFHTRKFHEINARVKEINGKAPTYARRDKGKQKEGKDYIKKKPRKSDDRTDSQRRFDDDSESSEDERPKVPVASTSKLKKKAAAKPRVSEPVRKPSRLAEETRRSLPAAPTIISDTESDEDPIQPTSDEEVLQELHKAKKGKGRIIGSRTVPPPRVKLTDDHRIQRVAQAASAFAEEVQNLEAPEIEEPLSPPRAASTRQQDVTIPSATVPRSASQDQDVTMTEPRPPSPFAQAEEVSDKPAWLTAMTKTFGKPKTKANDDIQDLWSGDESDTQTQTQAPVPSRSRLSAQPEEAPVASTSRLPAPAEEAFGSESDAPQPSKKRSSDGVHNTVFKKARLAHEEARSRRRNDADPEDQLALDEYPSRGKDKRTGKMPTNPTSESQLSKRKEAQEDESMQNGQDDSQLDQLEDSRMDQLEDSQVDQLAPSGSEDGIEVTGRSKARPSASTSRSRSKSHRTSAAPSRQSKSYSHSASPRKASPSPEEDPNEEDQPSASDDEVDDIRDDDARLRFHTVCSAVTFHAQNSPNALFRLPREIANLYHACGGVKTVMEARNKPRSMRNKHEKQLVRRGCFTKAQDRIIWKWYDKGKESEELERMMEEKGGSSGLKKRGKYLRDEGRMYRAK